MELQSGHSRRVQSILGMLPSQVKLVTTLRTLGSVFSVGAGMRIQPREKRANTAGGHSHA